MFSNEIAQYCNIHNDCYKCKLFRTDWCYLRYNNKSIYNINTINMEKKHDINNTQNKQFVFC